MKFHPEVLLSGLRKPANFSIDYTPISARVADLDLMLTISSTAALEAVGAGVPTVFIADLDVREQLGNHILLGSDLLRTFDQLERDDIGVPSKAWIDDYFFNINGVAPVEQIAERALELVQRTDRGQPRAWRTALFASQRELITYRKRAARSDPLTGDRIALRRAVARWTLPYGVQRRLRKARARRKAERVPAATQPPQVSADPPPGATTSSVTDELPPRDAARRPSRSRK